MRTIDADALRDKFQNLAYDDWNQGVSTSWANAYNECADIVDDMPTIDPPRMRGKWIDQKGGGCCCSECGRYALDEPDGNFIHVAVKSNYCPNCGADMRGDSNG